MNGNGKKRTATPRSDTQSPRESIDYGTPDFRQKYPPIPDKFDSAPCEDCGVRAVRTSCRWRNLLDDVSNDRGIDEDVRRIILQAASSRTRKEPHYDNPCAYQQHISCGAPLRLSDIITPYTWEGNGTGRASTKMDKAYRLDGLELEAYEDGLRWGTPTLRTVAADIAYKLYNGQHNYETVIQIMKEILEIKAGEKMTWPQAKTITLTQILEERRTRLLNRRKRLNRTE